jgi:NADPH2:quinone reductase
MKAIRVQQFGEPNVMCLEEVSPLVPTADKVLIEVEAIGVNPVDTYIRAGIYPVKPELPYTPGFDAAGIITATGPDVKHRRVGERVYCFGSISGCYAEQVLCQESQVYQLPANVNFSAGASMGVPYSTAYFALFYRAHTMPGETVLVHGASGAVGLAALQIARANGIRAIGTAGTREGLDLINQQGAAAALDHTKPDYLDSIDKLTCGQGLNVILEMLANINLQKDLELLAKFGRVVVIGNRGTIEIDPRAAMGRNASIMGMSLFNASEQELYSIHSALRAGLESGALKPIINSELALKEATLGHVKVMEPGAKGKIILVP